MLSEAYLREKFTATVSAHLTAQWTVLFLLGTCSLELFLPFSVSLDIDLKKT